MKHTGSLLNTNPQHMKKELNAVITIASRDFIKFIRDRFRIVATFIFPVIFIGILGGSLQSNLGKTVGYNFLTFVFMGVIGQTLFQSTASGIISLVRDREEDFAQEMFVSPVSRISIVMGKIVGESIVALAQILGIVIFAVIVKVPIEWAQFARVIPAMFVACLLGGAFGILVLANLGAQVSAQQVFPFIIFPQFFLSGVFAPIKNLPPVLLFFSRIAPMTYAVDFIRSIYYWGTPEYSKIVLFNPLINLIIIAVIFSVFLSVGTFLFIRNERNR